LWLKEPSEEKTPRGASELYQLIGLLIGTTWLLVITIPIQPLSFWLVRLIAALLAAYRVLEIFLFSLHWTFVAKAKLHGVRRSLASFILNLLEVALYSSIIIILAACAPPSASTWTVVYDNLRAVFSLGLPATEAFTVCRIIGHFELVIAGTLLLITVASLVGGVLRGEVEPPSDGAA
jgi:hypothetical protein